MKLLIIFFLMVNLAFAQDTVQIEEHSVFETNIQEKSEQELLVEPIVDPNFQENNENMAIESEEEPSSELSQEQIFNNEMQEELQEHQESALFSEEENFAYLFEEVAYDSENKQSNSIYAKFINYPKTVYTSQRFAIEIQTIITTQKFTKLETRFLNAKDVSIINPQDRWQKIAKNTYNNLYFFKVYTQEFQIPTMQIVLYNKDEVIDVLYLKPQALNYTNIAVQDTLFSNIIAKELKIISVKTRQYSNSELLTVLEIEAINGNLEDFRLKEFEEQLLMSLEESYPTQKLIYNTIIPIHTKEIKFNYFDTQTNRFKQMSVPIKLEEELVSTQTDLNPNDNNIELYKKIALGILTIVFIVLYIIKRKNSYIAIAIILSILFFIFAKPNGAMVIEENTNIYILPTKNSTVFYNTPNKQMVEILDKKRNFIKILFQLNDQNGKTVGWIKESNIVEN
ncbi:MAG: hypothetical protein WC141_00635 [Arcobacteraceae bacterium]